MPTNPLPEEIRSFNDLIVNVIMGQFLNIITDNIAL
jgi:hypothetical protein